MKVSESIDGILKNLTQMESVYLTKFVNFILKMKCNAAYEMDGNFPRLGIAQQVCAHEFTKSILYDILNDVMTSVHR